MHITCPNCKRETPNGRLYDLFLCELRVCVVCLQEAMTTKGWTPHVTA